MNKTCGDGVQRWQVFSFFVCLPFQFLFVWPVFLFSSFSKKRYLRYYSVMESLNFDQWFSNQKQIPEVSVLRNPRLLDIQGHLLSFGIFGPPKCALRRYDWMLRVCLLDTKHHGCNFLTVSFWFPWEFFGELRRGARSKKEFLRED